MTIARALRITGAVLVLSGAVSAVGCGFSEEEAIARCDQEQESHGLGTCFTAETYDSCVTAYQDCGDVSVDESACPIVYSCME